jgi:hypothetical protein
MNGGIKQFYWNHEGENLNDYLELVKLFNDEKFTSLFMIAFDNFNNNRQLLFNYKQLDHKRSEYIRTYLKVPDNDISYGQLYEDLIGDDLTMYFIRNASKFERQMLDYINANPKEFIR